MIGQTREGRRRLTRDEEQDLSRRIEAGDYPARDALVLANTWIVAVQVKHFADCGMDAEDLFSEGMLGLIDAAEKFTANGEARFATWASYRVRGAIYRAIDNYARLIRKGCHAEARARKGWKVRDQLREELGREPTHEEIAEKIDGLNPEKAESLRAAMTDHGDALTRVPPDDRDRCLSWFAVADTGERDDAETDARGLALRNTEKLRRLERAIPMLQRRMPDVAERVTGRKWARLKAGHLAAVVDKLDHVRVKEPEVYRAVVAALDFLREEVKRAE